MPQKQKIPLDAARIEFIHQSAVKRASMEVQLGAPLTPPPHKSYQYGTKGYNGGPQLCSHDAERCTSLGLLGNNSSPVRMKVYQYRQTRSWDLYSLLGPLFFVGTFILCWDLYSLFVPLFFVGTFIGTFDVCWDLFYWDLCCLLGPILGSLFFVGTFFLGHISSFGIIFIGVS